MPHANDIHLWYIDTTLSDNDEKACTASLDSSEQKRAANFKYPEDRKTYAITKAATREVLSKILGIAPSEIRFRKNPQGKPFIADEENPHDLQFNTSHCHALSLLALCHQWRIGVDVEAKRDMRNEARLVERFFHPQESAFYNALGEAERSSLFLRMWSAKEALAKAIGCSIHSNTANFELRLNAHNQLQVAAIHLDDEDAAHFQLIEVKVPEGYAAFIATDMPQQAVLKTFYYPKP